MNLGAKSRSPSARRLRFIPCTGVRVQEIRLASAALDHLLLNRSRLFLLLPIIRVYSDCACGVFMRAKSHERNVAALEEA
jgi:hypothetical protein